MTTRIRTLVCNSTRIILAVSPLCGLAMTAPLFATDAGHAHTVPARLVQIVRDAPRQFHYVNGALVGDGEIDATRPEALIYEPSAGRLRLVGVEFIVDAATWLASHPSAPVLEGQSFQLVGAPNRYGIPAPFFELHVWAWRDNPNGAFVDWNNHVTCEGQ